MTEAMHDLSRSAGLAPARAGGRTHTNGAPLRWMPGPDELRLPSCDDEPMPQNTHQSAAIGECFGCLLLHYRGQRDVFVGTDQFIHRDPDYHPKKKPGKAPVAPDVYVAFGVADRHRSSYVPWEEGKAPDFVLEVASPSSRKQDTEEKPGIYAEMGVQEFFLYDPDGGPEPALSGFELCDGEYKRLPEEELRDGVVGVRSEVLELCLCVGQPGPEPMDDALRFYDPATGEFLSTRYELAEGKRQAEEGRRKEAEGRRKEAEGRRKAERGRRREAAGRRRAEAKVAELKALVEKLQRD